MREHKFRAWNKETKTMSEPFTLEEVINSALHLPLADMVFLEWTGLNDKNGKEIYKGDVVRANKFWQKAAVHYFAPCWGVSNKNGVCTEFDFDEWETFKIIGNIYENPELLKTKN